jgi:excisionase family DNA binding protein
VNHPLFKPLALFDSEVRLLSEVKLLSESGVQTVKLLSPKDVSERLGVSPLTVIRLADEGSLQAVEVHKGAQRRLLRFRPETIEQFITARETRVEHAA